MRKQTLGDTKDHPSAPLENPQDAPALGLATRGVPLYVQIRESLRRQILNGTYKAQAQLPSEEELANTLHVSRMTVRHALSELVAEGMLRRRSGAGTFVIERKFLFDQSHLQSFWQATARLGMKPSSQLVSAETIAASPQIADPLEIQPGTNVYRICRLRFANSDPIAFHEAYIPAELVPNLLDEDLARESLYNIYERRGYSPVHGEQRISARSADDKLAQLLDTPLAAPLLYIERITRIATGMPIEFVYAFNHPERYALYMPLFR
jgi:GntR family transcriptional regulator